MKINANDIIAAIATPTGVGATGTIRLSGSGVFELTDTIFKGKKLNEQPGNSVHVGTLHTPGEGNLIDEVVVTLFRNPKSYTGEDVVEISGHGSPYILNKILETVLNAGARLAGPGEFTQRAFLNGKLDLAQAEAVADLIAADSKAAQQNALKQLRGGFSNDLQELREQLIYFAALIELELDFSDEDVEFADRSQFKRLLEKLMLRINALIESFKLGNVVKNGVRVAIIGKPNAGKSTLLNTLLNEERAIVSEIAGTTRDAIEETLTIHGILFRLIDTAGIREHSTDQIENIGIERSKQNAAKADIILHLIDLTDPDMADPSWLKQFETKTIKVHNKTDAWRKENSKEAMIADLANGINIVAKTGEGLEQVKNILFEKAVGDQFNNENTIVTNARHQHALQKVQESLLAVQQGVENNISGDFLTVDIRRALHYLGEITGQVEVDRDILGTIFSKFCIGK